jgi:hypothetical protein
VLRVLKEIPGLKGIRGRGFKETRVLRDLKEIPEPGYRVTLVLLVVQAFRATPARRGLPL